MLRYVAFYLLSLFVTGQESEIKLKRTKTKLIEAYRMFIYSRYFYMEPKRGPQPKL